MVLIIVELLIDCCILVELVTVEVPCELVWTVFVEAVLAIVDVEDGDPVDAIVVVDDDDCWEVEESLMCTVEEVDWDAVEISCVTIEVGFGCVEVARVVVAEVLGTFVDADVDELGVLPVVDEVVLVAIVFATKTREKLSVIFVTGSKIHQNGCDIHL